MKTPTIRLGDRKNAKHLYDVEVEGPNGPFTIEVDANTSSQASAVATKAGYVVRSVNMVG
jgi:hypothetical protein